MRRWSALAVNAAAAGALALLAMTLLPGGALAQPAPEGAVRAATELPGVDVGALTAAQLDSLRRVVADEFCYCGCPHTLGGCLREHTSCKHAPRMAQLAARLAGQGIPAPDIRKVLGDYYAGFDRSKRARLEVKDFGPPLGDAGAAVAIVEFSDFTCPFCQRIKPDLDRFVHDHADRVRLYYKPFPIASHRHALDAAIAGEWARDHGLFWKMYDQLFAHPHQLSENDLAGYAAAIGGDPDDLRKALETGRNQARIAASQAEGRAAGMAGTPTLYLNGHRLDLPFGQDLQSVLEFAVEDEEEWAKHGGWARD
jgi:protein-disulfide isomerase